MRIIEVESGLEGTVDNVELRRERGRRLSAARNRANMTADELVRRLSVVTRGRTDLTSSAVYGWEKGRNLLQEHVAAKIAPIVGCSLEELVGPLSPDELETGSSVSLDKVWLGGASASLTDEASSPTNSDHAEFELDLSLRSRSSGAIVRRRVWRLQFDRTKSEIIIRPTEGVAADALKVFRPDDASQQPLKSRLDYRDPSTIRIPFDFNSLAPGEDTPVVFLQQSLEALPIFADDLPSPSIPSDDYSTPKRTVRTRKLSKDLQFELADFLDDTTAQRLTALWEESSDRGEHLEHYCERILSVEKDAFRKRLQEALIFTSLRKNHERAREAIDFLITLSGQDPRRLVDAYYLSGRCHWYLEADTQDRSHLPHAIADLAKSLELAKSLNNSVRMGQCYVYLARIAIEQANFRKSVEATVGYDAVQLADMAKDIGSKNRRPDIEFLAERLHVIRHYGNKEYEECIVRGERLLDRIRAASAAGFDFSSIQGNLAIHLAMAYRHRNSGEDDRRRAEQIYLDGISTDRNDSHAGICMYLLGDIFSDRMIDALTVAAQNPDSSQSGESSVAAEQHRIQAQEWYDRASDTLKERGDRKAARKAAYRSLWVRSGETQPAQTRQVVATSHAAREAAIHQRLVGSSFRNRIQRIPVTLVEKLLQVTHLNANSTQDELHSFSVRDFVDEQSILLLPRNLGTTFMVQALTRESPDALDFDIKGWFSLPAYSSEVRPMLRRFQQDASQLSWGPEQLDRFLDHSKECWFDLLNRMATIEPLQVSKPTKIVILAPDDHLDALIPIESLVEVVSPDRKLLSCSESIVYAGPWASPLRTGSVSVNGRDMRLYADRHELKEVGSSRGRGHSLTEIAAYHLGMESEPLPGHNEAVQGDVVAILAHADAEHQLRDTIRTWKWDGVRAVFLLFCGSGTFDLIQGPFSDGLAQRIRCQLGGDGIVVSNRLPISAEEAIRFLGVVQREAIPTKSVATVLAGYMRDRLTGHHNPFSFPWFAI